MPAAYFNRLSSLLDSDAHEAIREYHQRVNCALQLPDAREWVADCVEAGVPPIELEALLCVTLARYELGPRRIELAVLARRGDNIALGYLQKIDAILAAADRLANETDGLFKFEDPTRPPQEARDALDALVRHFKLSPVREQELREEFGAPGRFRRRRAKPGVLSNKDVRRQRAMRHAALGFFDFKMRAAGVSDDELIVNILGRVICHADKDDLRRYRLDYARRHGR